MSPANMRKLVVSEWVTLDSVLDADTMKEWFDPYDSDDRREYIKETVLSSGAILLGRDLPSPCLGSAQCTQLGGRWRDGVSRGAS